MSRHETDRPAAPGTRPPRIEQVIAEAIGRIRYGNVVVHIQDGVVVQIESTEKRRFGNHPQLSDS
jgi:hypothetical protein